MKTYYIAYNKNNEVEEIFVDATTAYFYGKDTGFKIVKVEEKNA